LLHGVRRQDAPDLTPACAVDGKQYAATVGRTRERELVPTAIRGFIVMIVVMRYP